MTRARLSGFGQVIDSDRPIDGAVSAHDDTVPGIVIRHHPPAAQQPAELYTRCDGGLVFAPPGVGMYRCRADAIDIVPCPDADPAAVAALLIATALPAVLWLQGRFMLHAAVVRLPSCAGAIAIAGRSGVGKSTVAAALLARGASLVADDSVALSDTGLASGLAGGLFETIDAEHRRFAAAAPDRHLISAPLAAIFVLARGDGPCTRLAPLAAVEQILRHRHRPRIPALIGRQREMLTTSTLLSTAIPVYAWPRREGASPLDDAEWRMLVQASRQTRDV